tara:strand:+ start:466 stop:786 length:321 start_codon:yes stop_codon:yes gene_type:complete
MMETYAERLKKEGRDMTNYDMDELRRRGEIPDEIERMKDREKKSRGVQTTNIEIEIPDQELLHLAKAAHDRDITLNQLCIDVLKNAFDDLDYRFEHSSKPVVLKEY